MKPNIIILFRSFNPRIKHLKNILEAKGYNVIVIEDSLTFCMAIENIKLDLGIDVLFTEIILQKMDGVELLNRLVEFGAPFPILITSFHMEADQGKIFEKQDAFRYIPHSLNTNELLDLVIEATAYNLNVKY